MDYIVNYVCSIYERTTELFERLARDGAVPPIPPPHLYDQPRTCISFGRFLWYCFPGTAGDLLPGSTRSGTYPFARASSAAPRADDAASASSFTTLIRPSAR